MMEHVITSYSNFTEDLYGGIKAILDKCATNSIHNLEENMKADTAQLKSCILDLGEKEKIIPMTNGSNLL